MFFRKGLTIVVVVTLLVVIGLITRAGKNPNVVSSQLQRSGLTCKNARESVRLTYGNRVIGRCHSNDKNTKVIATRATTYTVEKRKTGIWPFREWKDYVQVQTNG